MRPECRINCKMTPLTSVKQISICYVTHYRHCVWSSVKMQCNIRYVIHYCLGDVWVRIRKTIVQTDGDGRAGAHCEYNQGILVDQPQKPLMAIMPLAMAIIAHVEYGHSLVVLLSYNIWDGGAGPAGRGHDHRYWRAQGWLPPWRLPSQPRPGRSLRSLHRTTIKSHLSLIGPGMCWIVVLSHIKGEIHRSH